MSKHSPDCNCCSCSGYGGLGEKPARRCIAQGRAVMVSAVERWGIELPKGWKRKGCLYMPPTNKPGKAKK